MVEPGDEAGECLRCGQTTTAIGHGHSVVAVWCDGDGGCGLIVAATEDAESLHDAEAVGGGGPP